jgi:biotin carboxyl carrier protein
MNKYQYKVKGVDYEVEIAEVEGNIAKVNVNGIPFEIELQKPINAAKHPTMTSPKVQAPQPVAAQPAAQSAPAAQAASAPAAGAGTPVKAPLPGTVTEIKVQVGQQVNVGDTVLVLEAMKMANNLQAEKAGKVSAICVKIGESVMEDDPLVVIE